MDSKIWAINFNLMNDVIGDDCNKDQLIYKISRCPKRNTLIMRAHPSTTRTVVNRLHSGVTEIGNRALGSPHRFDN